jgi:hypothetical protein
MHILKHTRGNKTIETGLHDHTKFHHNWNEVQPARFDNMQVWACVPFSKIFLTDIESLCNTVFLLFYRPDVSITIQRRFRQILQ